MNSFKSLLILFSLLSINAFASVEEGDWQNYLTKSCNTTITGSVKKALNERGFWAHVNVSMDAWAQGMRLDKPEEYCYIRYQAPSERTRLMQCLAYTKEKWDWYQRCKPIVVNACRVAGGVKAPLFNMTAVPLV
jgi:hypothetical protein